MFDTFSAMPKRTRSVAQLGNYKLYRAPKVRKTATARQNQIMRRRSRRFNTTHGLLGVEHKFYDTSFSGALNNPTDSTGGECDPATVGALTVPSQGDSALQRDGKQIIGEYLVIKGQVYFTLNEAQGAPPGGVYAYVAVVLDTQTNGAQLNSEDVFKNQAGTLPLNVFPLKNLLFGKRFRILKEGRFRMDNTAIAQNGADNFSWPSRTAPIDWYIPLKKLKINFNGGTTSDVANVIDNSVHVIGFTNYTTAGNVPTLTYQARFRFIG